MKSKYHPSLKDFFGSQGVKPRKGENPSVYFMNSEHVRRLSESLGRFTALEQLKLVLVFVTLKLVDYLGRMIEQFRNSLKELIVYVQIMYRDEDNQGRSFDLDLKGFDELRVMSLSLDDKHFYLKETGLFFERLLKLKNLKTVAIRTKGILKDVIEGSVRENPNLMEKLGRFEISKGYSGEVWLKKSG